MNFRLLPDNLRLVTYCLLLCVMNSVKCVASYPTMHVLSRLVCYYAIFFAFYPTACVLFMCCLMLCLIYSVKWSPFHLTTCVLSRLVCCCMHACIIVINVSHFALQRAPCNDLFGVTYRPMCNV